MSGREMRKKVTLFSDSGLEVYARLAIQHCRPSILSSVSSQAQAQPQRRKPQARTNAQIL
jgi:hypothetical protein